MTMLTLRSAQSSPYAVLAESAGSQPAPQRKRSLLSMSRLAEAQTLSAPAGAIILAVLQESRHYTPSTEARYRRLADRGVKVVLFAHGWTDVIEPTPGLLLAGLEPEDSARDEWDVLVCTPTRRFGFVSLDLHENTADEMDRKFGWLTSKDDDALGRAADALLTRLPFSRLRVPPLVR